MAYLYLLCSRGVFSHPLVTKFWDDTPRKGTTQKFKFSKLTDIVKQIVYIGVVDPAESKFGLVFELGLLLFVANFENLLKTSGCNCWPNTPLNQIKLLK